MDLREMGCDPGDWIAHAEDRTNGGLMWNRVEGKLVNYLTLLE